MGEAENVEEANVDWAILLVKPKQGPLLLQNLEDQPGPETLDDLYKEITLLERNLRADHQAAVHVAKMMEAAQQMQGMQKSGLVTPPGVKV